MQDTPLTHIPLEPLDNTRTAATPSKDDTDAAQRARRALELAETAPDGTPALALACELIATAGGKELTPDGDQHVAHRHNPRAL